MRVYVVYREYQADTPCFEFAFLSQEEAEEYAEELRGDLYAEGANVYGYEPPAEASVSGHEADQEWNWTTDVHVEPVEIREPVATPPAGMAEGMPFNLPTLESIAWQASNPGRLTAVARIEVLLVHVEAIRVSEANGLQVVSTDGLTPEDAVLNRKIYEDLQQVHAGRFATSPISGHPGNWVCFAFPFLE
jgi:hypothetical protein